DRARVAPRMPGARLEVADPDGDDEVGVGGRDVELQLVELPGGALRPGLPVHVELEPELRREAGGERHEGRADAVDGRADADGHLVLVGRVTVELQSEADDRAALLGQG